MKPAESVIIRPHYAPLLTHSGFSAPWIFSGDQVVVWRKLADRENGTLDVSWPDGRAVRLHVKRYPLAHAGTAEVEALALQTLEKQGIPCAALVAFGRVAGVGGFIITEDLAGFEAADKLLAGGVGFEKLLNPTADLAARLHTAGLHHRDLYLCHFFVRVGEADSDVEARLIDAARVRRLPAWPMRRRWVVKDLAQFWYSMTQLPISEEQRGRWLARYAAGGAMGSAPSLRRAIEAKARRIASHDQRLNRREPTRNISIPKAG